MICLLHDQPVLYSEKELTRDMNTITRRFQNEGLSFFTKCIPALGKAFDRALSGNESFCCTSAFAKRKSTCIPQFLGSAILRVFDASGNLLKEPCVATIKWLRTFFFYAYKIEIPYDDELQEEYCQSFVNNDQYVETFDHFKDTVALRNLMRHQLAKIFSNYEIGKPSYGSGVSSDYRRNDRYSHYVPPTKLRLHFGRNFFMQPDEYWLMELWLTYVFCYFGSFCDVNFPEETHNPFSKVLFVPKDSRGPRVICCEPMDHMYAQKAVQTAIYRIVESHGETQGRVNFTDQSINQNLTFNPRYATIDLKDASDLVSLDLVTDVFPPHILADMLACRTPIAHLPNGLDIPLTKFAPMGNALCFPVMALIAYTGIAAGIQLAGGLISRRQHELFVYGDDIIIPNEYAEVAMRTLEALGLKVNRSKSFVNSRFRESCGQDTFDLSNVTPIRRRKLLSPIKRDRVKRRNVLDDGNGFIPHTVSTANKLFQAGYKKTADNLFTVVESLLKTPLPYGVEKSGFLCRICDTTEEAWRNNQVELIERRGKIRAYCVRDRELILTKLSEYGRLRRNLLEGGGEQPLSVEKIGLRKPYLQQSSLVKYYDGAYG